MSNLAEQEDVTVGSAEQGTLELAARPLVNKVPDTSEGAPLHERNRLVSEMLQNRGVLRLVCAPRGYGKTSLAREYARRMFPGKHVEWVDASAPAFLVGLDRGHLVGFDEMRIEQPALIVIDDVPWLHEQRAAILSRRIDAALYRGVEVLAITLPSCDCLGSLRAERVLVSAHDLELTEQDCMEVQKDRKPRARARAAMMWHHACSDALGKVPAVAWGDADEMRERVLKWFFDEKLPIATLRAAFALMVIGEGTLADLARVGAELREEDARLLARDYPFLCIDPGQGTFRFPRCALGVLRSAMEESGAAELFGTGSEAFLDKILSAIMARGDLGRMEEALGVFCTDDQCAQWLLDCGWELLDRGEAELVDALFRRCPCAQLEQLPALQAIRSWTSGLIGDARESRFYAQEILGKGSSASENDDEQTQATAALAYLALVAFGSGGAAVYRKGTFSPECSPVTPGGFLARVTDLCSEDEVIRAFACWGSEEDPGASREMASENRERALAALFTGAADKFKGEMFYRLAFHLLCFVDSEKLKPVVQGVGCEIVVRSRRAGRLTCTEAENVRDLWRAGFFGVMGPGTDGRDAKLLEDAGKILRRGALLRGDKPADVPWDIECQFRKVTRSSGPARLGGDEVAIAHVRLFGSFEVTVGDRYVKDSEWRKKSRLLLILVVLYQGRDVSRDSLFEQVWPGLSRVRALDNFYSAWSSASALLGDGPYLERSGSFCRVNPRYLVSDVAEFEQLTRRLLTEHPDTNTLLDLYARIESLYRGGLVPSEADNEFINSQRERYQATYIDAMISAAECSLKANDARLALWFARKAKESTSGREDVYQILMRAQVAAGQRCSAIKSYFECRQYLRDELGLDPSCEVQDLYNKLISVDPTLLQLDPSSFRRR